MHIRTDLGDLNLRHDTSERGRAWVKDVRCIGRGPHGGYRELSETWQKAAVSATTTGNAFGVSRLAKPFLVTIPRLLNQLVGVLQVPPLLPIPVGDVNAAATFITEGFPIPLTRFDLGTTVLGPAKLAQIITFSLEFMRANDDRVVSLTELLLAESIRRGEESALLDSAAAVPGGRPPGLLFGKSPVAAATAGDIADAIGELWISVRNGEPIRPYFICSKARAIYLGGLHASGVPLFPDVKAVGIGEALGVPQLTSSGAGDNLILLDASTLAISDEGLVVDYADAAALQQDDAPTNSATNLVPMFQTNSIALRMLRYLDWALAYPDGVGYITLPAVAVA